MDSHKRYTVVAVEDEKGNIISEGRIKHKREAITTYLRQFTQGSNVAVGSSGTGTGLLMRSKKRA